MVGAGICGLGIGWRLAAAGCRVDVFDSGEAGRGASWAAAGMLAARVETEPGEEPLLVLVVLDALQKLHDSIPDPVEDSGQIVVVVVGYFRCASLRSEDRKLSHDAAQFRVRHEWMHTGRERPLWDRVYVHHVSHELDLDAMRHAAAMLVGEHDFAAFAKAGHGRETTVRTVLSCEVTQQGAHDLAIDISGTGFLHNMVRIVAGTLVDVGRGRFEPDQVARMIERGDRSLAGPTAPPQGLYLVSVEYGD